MENAAAIDRVRAVVAALHGSIAFDPAEVTKRLGIKADIGVHGAVSA